MLTWFRHTRPAEPLERPAMSPARIPMITRSHLDNVVSSSPVRRSIGPEHVNLEWMMSMEAVGVVEHLVTFLDDGNGGRRPGPARSPIGHLVHGASMVRQPVSASYGHR
jgi:hypothetical protein